ncbi:Hypothetical protein A7982_11156 [Minicystis rosea]|nr:Hypothetical protein A7982_11156 [Minicystis rosea]
MATTIRFPAPRAALLAAMLVSCVSAHPLGSATDHTRPPTEPPACAEVAAEPGPWPRAAGIARVATDGHLEQRFVGSSPVRLRFLGTHLFDLLDKLEHEGGPTDLDRHRVVCAALNAAAAAGAPVVRLWGSLKQTGTIAETKRAAELLALVLDENARRRRPLRFVVTLLNHQSGYGAPRPEASLDDQDPESAWNARRIYVEGSWRARGAGQILDRIEALRARPEIASSPYVLAWELVNELETYRAVAAGSLRGPEADALRDRFLVPALDALATSFPQPIMLGDLRGAEAGYADFARSVVAALPAEARARLIWTSHVYAPLDADPAELRRATWKLDLDLRIAAELGRPFLLGEIGQHLRGEAPFCGEGTAHDPARLFTAALETRRAIEAALFWGEGHCGLPVPGTGRRITIGAGGDSADLAPGDTAARSAVRAARALARFRSD